MPVSCQMVADWPLQTIFCFPMYYYPIFIIAGLIIYLLILKVLSGLNAVTMDSKKSKQFIAQQIQQTRQYLINLTPLNIDIVNIIVDQYLFDQLDQNRFLRMLNSKLEFQSKIVLRFLLIYSFIGVILYILCFIIIIIEFVEWQRDHHHNNMSERDGFQQFQVYLLTILHVHPFWKMINWTTSIVIVHDGYNIPMFGDSRMNRNLIAYIYYGIFGIPYVLIFVGFVVPAFFIMIIPSMIIFIPITCCVSCICCGLLCWLDTNWKWSEIMEYIAKKLTAENNHYLEYSQYPIIQALGATIFIMIFYILMRLMLPSISCFYESGNWVQCFVDGFTLQYCPNIIVDSNNWKADILLVTWILF